MAKTRGANAHIVTKAKQDTVHRLATLKCTQQQICDAIHIKDPKTLRKYYADELTAGKTVLWEMTNDVMRALYKSAVTGEKVAAQISWMKMMGWYEHMMPREVEAPQKVVNEVRFIGLEPGEKAPESFESDEEGDSEGYTH